MPTLMNYVSKNIGFLFDLDGVIIDSESEYTRIWAQINREFPTGVENLEQVIKGCTLSKILKDNYHDDSTRNKVACRLHELESVMSYEYLPAAREFLDELNTRSLPCVLVTSSDNKKMIHLKEELPNLLDFFSFVITGDMVSTSKPSPEGYLLGASKINCSPSNCVVFEDSLQGVMAGKNSDAYVVGIEGTLPGSTLAPYSHIVIKRLDDIDLDDLIRILTER